MNANVIGELARATQDGSVPFVEIGRLHRLLYFGYIREHYRGSQGLGREGLMEASGPDLRRRNTAGPATALPNVDLAGAP